MRKRALCGLLLLVTSPLVAQESPAQQDPVSIEYEVLLNTRDFSGSATGDGGEPTASVLALRLMLLRPRSEARTLFLDLIEQAHPGGQLYALCGLYLIDRPLFEQAMQPFLADERVIDFCPSGCSIVAARVRDVVRSPSRYAVRLPHDFQGRDWWRWVEVQDWPQGALPRTDIVGGAFPVEVGRHIGFGQPRSPKETLPHWLRQLAEEGEFEDCGTIAYAISRFGDLGFQLARRMATHEDPKARYVAASVVASMGVEHLGPKAEEAARLVAPLLRDYHAEVAAEAAYALYVLAPWIRTSQPEIVEVLKDLRQRVKAEADLETLKFASFVIDPLASMVGVEAVPALIELLDSPNEDLRCAASCALGRIGAPAAAARPALAQRIADPALECALEALARIGLEPGGTEIEHVIALLQHEDADYVLEAAGMLGDLGPAVRAEAGQAIADALRRWESDDRLAAALAEAHWRITGKSDRLIERLVLWLATETHGWEYVSGPLLDALEEQPALLQELKPFLRGPDATTRRVAVRALSSLGRKAHPLATDLRVAVGTLDPDDPGAVEAALALHRVSDDPSLGLRIGRRLLERDPEAGLDLVSGLGSAALPLLDSLAELTTVTHVDRRALRVLASLGVAAAGVTVPLFEATIRTNTKEQFTALRGLETLAKAGSDRAKTALARIATGADDLYLRSRAEEAIDSVQAED